MLEVKFSVSLPPAPSKLNDVTPEKLISCPPLSE
jgi:hypothetical protein